MLVRALKATSGGDAPPAAARTPAAPSEGPIGLSERHVALSWQSADLSASAAVCNARYRMVPTRLARPAGVEVEPTVRRRAARYCFEPSRAHPCLAW